MAARTVAGKEGSRAPASRLDLLRRGDDLNEALKEAVEHWLPVREKTIPMLREIAVTIDELYKSHEEAQRTEDSTGPGILQKLVEGIKRYATCHSEPSLVDQIIATVNLAEAQKQMDDDHSATHTVLGIISDIEELVNHMTHLKTQAKKNEMMSILLNISPGSLAHATDMGTELAIDIGEIAEGLAAAGKKIIGFGETALKIGGVASRLGKTSGWIPGVGTVSPDVGKAGEAVEKTGTITTWAGELLEDFGDATATVSAQAGELSLRLGGLNTHAADVNIQMSLFPVNIEKMVRGGVTASRVDGSETNVSHELRSKATTYETQMRDILAAVHEGNVQ
jgi:hypothetical protein